jgi:hypothetical protein
MFTKVHRYALVLTLSLVSPSFAEIQPGCPCDCDGDGEVTVAELVAAVAVAIGRAAFATCTAADVDGSGTVAVNELIQGVAAALYGCGVPPPTATPAPTQTPNADDQVPPIGQEKLIPWLEAGNYLRWAAESAPHPSGGPHFGGVRTFVNDLLFRSLSDDSAQHPIGATAVKELYGRDGSEVLGFAVSVKLESDSMGGANWYWFESFNGPLVDRIGATSCTGCHDSNYRTFTSRDLILIPFPLQ